MKPFQQKPECEKCGSLDIYTQLSAKGNLLRKCLICDHKWAEYTKDAPETLNHIEIYKAMVDHYAEKVNCYASAVDEYRKENPEVVKEEPEQLHYTPNEWKSICECLKQMKRYNTML